MLEGDSKQNLISLDVSPSFVANETFQHKFFEISSNDFISFFLLVGYFGVLIIFFGKL